MKIGQEIEFKNDFKIETYLRGTTLQVKKGNKALATRKGFKILNGEAGGKIISYQEHEKLKGYDHQNIAKIIINRLVYGYGMDLLFEDEGIEISELMEEVEDILTDIL